MHYIKNRIFLWFHFYNVLQEIVTVTADFGPWYVHLVNLLEEVGFFLKTTGKREWQLTKRTCISQILATFYVKSAHQMITCINLCQILIMGGEY